MLRRTTLAALGAAVLGVIAVAAAGAAATPPKLVFATQVSWTREIGFVAVLPDVGLECRVDARLDARSAVFYTARSRAPRNRHVRFGTTASSRPMLTGVGYRAGSLRVAGTATLEIQPTRCSDGSVDRRCAGAFRAALEIEQVFLSREAGPRGAVSLNWAHKAPRPPTPMPAQACLGRADPVAFASGGTMTLFVTAGFVGNHGCFQQVPFQDTALLTRSTVSTSTERTGDCVTPPFEVRDFRSISRTRATFRRVR
jgi:hypothetical protein